MIEQKLKTFRITGWVQVEVSATFQAKNKTEAKKLFKETEKKYGSGNGSNWDYEEGNWASGVTFDRCEGEEVEEVI